MNIHGYVNVYGFCLLLPYPSTYPHIHISSTHSYTVTLIHTHTPTHYSASYIIKNPKKVKKAFTSLGITKAAEKLAVMKSEGGECIYMDM